MKRLRLPPSRICDYVSVMKMKNLALIAMASTAAIQFAHAQYTFGPEVQSTPSASITYNYGIGAFQYTDTAHSSDDSAYLPLTGSAATFITTSNDWTASVSVNISARWMTTANGNSPHVSVSLAILLYTNGPMDYSVVIALDQKAPTGSNHLFPTGFYGTDVELFAVTNGHGDVTTPLGTSENLNAGASFLFLSGGTNASSPTILYSAASGVLTLDYKASTSTVTGYYNGTPVGSYSLADWGSNPPLTLALIGGSGEGIAVPTGTNTVTASSFYAGPWQYTFGPQVQTTPSASITYDSESDTFQYTDATNTESAGAYLPLSGSAAALVTTLNGWTASINTSLSDTTLSVSGGVDDPHTGVYLGIIAVDGSNNAIHFLIQLVQMNNTAGGDTSDFPLGFYGSAVRVAGGTFLPMPLGNAFAYSNNVYTGGDCAILALAAGTNASGADEWVGATNGILTLTYDASTTLITAYFNQEPVAAQSIAGWSQLTLVVGGGDKEVGATNGSITASSFNVSVLPTGNPVIQATNGSFGVRTNQFGFTINWASGMSVAVDACTNLANPTWIPLATNTLTGGSLYFSDPDWSKYPTRFYRLRWP